MKKLFPILALMLASFVAPAQTARVQVIHNCADAAAGTVDVWLNNTVLIDDFVFRTATPFVNAPAGVPFDLTICGPTSTDTTQEVIRFSNLMLASGATYVITANGIVSPTGYSPNPTFTLDIFPLALEVGSNVSNTDLLIVHGSTDAPTVDVEESVSGSTLVNDLAYGTYTSTYLSLPTADYTIDVTDATGSVIVATYSAPLQTLMLQGAALTVVASGFLNPANNSGGPAFGLWVATAIGGNLIPLPLVPTSVAENTTLSNISLFPNPTTTELNVSTTFDQNYSTVTIQVLDVTGRLLSTNDLGAASQGTFRYILNTSALEQGVYIVEILADGKVSRQQIQIIR
jgi:hypothetical protein